MTSDQMIYAIASLLVGLVIPAVSYVVTKDVASAGLKVFMSALLAATTGAVTGVLSSIPHGWSQWEPIVLNMVLAWVAAAITFATGYSPVGSIHWYAAKTRKFGLNDRRQPPEPVVA